MDLTLIQLLPLSRAGAFTPQLPVQPVLLKYQNRLVSGREQTPSISAMYLPT